MRPIEAVITWPGIRPGPGWHAHGTTLKHLWVVHDGRLAWVQLRKPRWRDAATGETRHDRPTWDVPGSPYGLDVVFTLVNVWVSSAVGLLRTDWPWHDDRPSRRSVQRWSRCLMPEADAWLRAIRLAAIELAAPRPLEEYLPTGGSPRRRGARVAVRTLPQLGGSRAVVGSSRKRRELSVCRSAPSWARRDGGGPRRTPAPTDPRPPTGGSAAPCVLRVRRLERSVSHRRCRRRRRGVPAGLETPKEVVMSRGPDGAVSALFSASQGVPRQLNQLALQAMVDAVVHGLDTVDQNLMKRVLQAHPLYAVTRS